ncbi:hypothetical protein [Comamonas sp. SCN 65-56]|uniref:hypothetical protein n=1 Tax=Comamonas sp. SCN 65-56 TaxID=1660095 RepID=UPI0025BF6097|nr:hypothetical protein [Comamonas sp. SCN 65-56]
MKNPPTIESARLAAPAVLELAWSTGETLCVDLTDLPKRNLTTAERPVRPHPRACSWAT